MGSSMTLAFPASPTVGDYYSPGSRVWRWNGDVWEIVKPVQFAKVGERVETITPVPERGNIRLIDGPAPIIIAFLLSAVCAFGQAPTVSKVLMDVKMSNGKFQERELTPAPNQFIGFDAELNLVVKEGGSGGSSPIFDEIELTNGVIKAPIGAVLYDYFDTVDSSAAPCFQVRLFDDQDPAQQIGAALFGFRGDGAGSGHQFFQGSTNNFTFEGVSGVGLGNVTAATFIGNGSALTGITAAQVGALTPSGNGSGLTNLNASNISSGTLNSDRLPTVPVANGGTSTTTLAANAVLLGNGTSALQTVAPGTSGNVLTSNGTTWTSAALTTTNPAGSGSELQFRSSGSTFGAVTNSSVSGGALTLGNAEALGTTPTAYLTLRNTTAATSGNQQVSPSIVLEGRGWKTTATAASETVRFRQNVLPVQGTTNPTAHWRVQSEINNSGTWTDRLLLTSDQALHAGRWSVINNGNGFSFRVDSALIFGVRGNTGANMHPNHSWGWTSNAVDLGEPQDLALWRDAANTLAQRNGANAQTFRIYEIDSGANDEYLELSAASGTNLIRPQATGTGTASVVRYHTTPSVFWTSGSGSPEFIIIAPVGSLYTRTDGGAGTTLYVKESGTSSTGWVAK